MATSSTPTLPVEKLHPDEAQPRKHFDPDLHKGLVASVKLLGIIQPIAVQPNGDGFTIVAGERRWRAAKAAGLKTVPVHFVDGAAISLATAENVTRADLNPVEEGDAYLALIELGEKPRTIAKIVGRKQERVEERIEFAKLPAPIRDGIADGRCTIPAARVLAKVAQVSPELAVAVAKAATSREIADRPDAVIRNLYSDQPTKPCERCDGHGYLYDGKPFDGDPWELDEDDDKIEDCPECGTHGQVPDADAAELPFLVRADATIDRAVIDLLVSHVPDETAVKLMEAWQTWEAGIAETGLGRYTYRPPALDLAGPAGSYGCLFRTAELTVGGNGLDYVTDAAFAAEYVPDALTAALKEAKKRGKEVARYAGKPVTDDDKAAQREEARKQREKDAKARKQAEAYNLDLGRALTTARFAKPKVTTAAMKLLVGTLLDAHLAVEQHSWSTGEDTYKPSGLAMFRRFTEEPESRDKKGQAKYLRKHDAVSDAVAQVHRELAQAKTPEEVLGVAFRVLGAAAFVKLDGLPKADVEGCHDEGFKRGEEAEALLVKLLPAALRDRVPAKEGRWDWNQ